MALEFNKHFLSGNVGDLAKHIGLLGAPLLHEQKPLHEYDFRVQAVGRDLRDGAILCRVLERLCSNDRRLTSQLRLPATSRTNKQRNVEIALRSLREAAHSALPYANGDSDTRARDLLVDGNCEGTFAILWHLAAEIAMPRVAEAAELSLEVKQAAQSATRKNQLYVAPVAADTSIGSQLLCWVQAVCAVYDVRTTNLGGSLRDGVALCLVLQYYTPELLGDEELHIDQVRHALIRTVRCVPASFHFALTGRRHRSTSTTSKRRTTWSTMTRPTRPSSSAPPCTPQPSAGSRSSPRASPRWGACRCSSASPMPRSRAPTSRWPRSCCLISSTG